MLRIIVDSGSSIKEAEKEKYGVDILPLGVQIGEDSYQDGQTLTVDNFYDRLRASKSFPKTSLPSLMDARELVKRYIAQVDHVLIITISSGISGTYNSDFHLYPSIVYLYSPFIYFSILSRPSIIFSIDVA